MENVLYFILKKFFPFLRKSDCEILPLNIMWEIFFFKNHAENKGGEIVPDLLFLKKLCMREKQVVFTLVLKYCDSPPLGHTIKKLYETRDCWSRGSILIFLEKGWELVFPVDFMYDFSSKMFLMLYSITWPDLTFWLPVLFEILGNMCTELFVNQIMTS